MMIKPVLSKLLSLAQTEQFHAMENADTQWDFINQYCIECHNFEDYSGGLDFTTMFVGEVPQNSQVWEKAIQKLRGRMMPPPDRN